MPWPVMLVVLVVLACGFEGRVSRSASFDSDQTTSNGQGEGPCDVIRRTFNVGEGDVR